MISQDPSSVAGSPHPCTTGEPFHFKPHGVFAKCVFAMTYEVIEGGFTVEVGSGPLTYIVSGVFVPSRTLDAAGGTRFSADCFEMSDVSVRFPEGHVEQLPRRCVGSVVAEHADEIKMRVREQYEKETGL